jgi:Fur family ferric uptake transcriptional regulator
MPHATRSSRSPSPAHALLARCGARATPARIEVLATLLAAGEALPHHEIEKRIGRRHGVDRVTLYRVLDWLTAQGLAHRHAGDDRVWRFAAAPPAGDKEPISASPHAHFECSECGRIVCLAISAPPTVRVPAGFRRREVEVTVRGWCAECAR